MAGNKQKIRLGVFVISALGLLGSIILIVSGSKLFERRDTYYVRYLNAPVSGLEVGAQVRYNGIRIGRIEEIGIAPDDINAVVVELSVKPHTPIVRDSRAYLTGQGITGLKYIEIHGGSNQAPRLASGDTIQPGQSTLDKLGNQAEIILDKLHLILTNLSTLTGDENQSRITQLIDNLNSSLSGLSLMMQDNRHSFAAGMKNMDQITHNLIETTRRTNTLLANLDTLTSPQRLGSTLDNIHQISEQLKKSQLDSLSANLNQLLITSDQAMANLNSLLLTNRQDLRRSVSLLKETLDNLDEFSRLISEDPSILIRGKKLPEINR